MTDDELEDAPGAGTVVRDLMSSYGVISNTLKNSVLVVNLNTSHTLLSEIRSINNEADLSAIVSSLVGKQFSIDVTKIAKLSAQLEIHFRHCSIIDDDILSCALYSSRSHRYTVGNGTCYTVSIKGSTVHKTCDST